MSVHIMSQVWQHSTAKGSQLLLLLAIADHADDNGVAYPGVDSLAKKTRLSRRQTQYNIESLVVMGELEILHSGGGGPRDTNKYRVTPKGAIPAPIDDTRVQSATPKGAICDTKRVQPIAPESSREPSKEPSLSSAKPKTRKRQIYPEDFESFWLAYPKGHGVKKLAYAEWQKIDPDDSLMAEMMNGLMAWKQSRRWADGYVRDAERFLKYRLWENPPEGMVSVARAKRSEPQAGDPYITQMLGRT